MPIATTLSPEKKRPVSIALVGNPNTGKTVLFNRLTGKNQKVANYAGVTIERVSGVFTASGGQTFHVTDLPGIYSLHPQSPDEAITLQVLQGSRKDEAPVDMVVLVVDANNLRRQLQLAIAVQQLGYPTIVALNMMDIAQSRGLEMDVQALSQEIGMPVVETVAIRSNGITSLLACVEEMAATLPPEPIPSRIQARAHEHDTGYVMERVRRILDVSIRTHPGPDTRGDRIDAVVLHPVLGYLILAVILFVMFQAVFTLAEYPMELLQFATEQTGLFLGSVLPDGMLNSLVVDGILAGVGAVVVFLPQILILFLFILALEESGYLPRAAFLLDSPMRFAGLSGRAFIPLLSSHACTIPGIMATRTIQNSRTRLATILIAPLMVCSGRLPVYTLLIGAFIPDIHIGIFNLQGIVLFGLYAGGILLAMSISLVMKFIRRDQQYQPLMMELPIYRLPGITRLASGLLEQAKLFLLRAGSIILALMIVLWFLASFPAAPADATLPAIQYSFAGQLGRLLQYAFAPLGFNWEICIALIPGMAAREAMIAALGTIYALSESGDALSSALTTIIATGWGLPTGMSLLAWYVFAPQCLPMLIITRRETGSWKYAGIMAGYLFAFAWVAAFITYRVALFFTGS